MFSAKLVATTIALFTFASANPVLQARSCTPNFQGSALTIFKTELGSPFQWQPTNTVGGHITLTPANTQSKFLVADSGQPDSNFVFKYTDRSLQLPVQGFANGSLTFEGIQFTGSTENFLINCFSCGGSADIAAGTDGCTATLTVTHCSNCRGVGRLED